MPYSIIKSNTLVSKDPVHTLVVIPDTSNSGVSSYEEAKELKEFLEAVFKKETLEEMAILFHDKYF
jgi:hypothetical protein